MQWLRWSVIVGLMIGLPAWAVLGDSDRLSAILNLKPSDASERATDKIASLVDGEQGHNESADPTDDLEVGGADGVSSVYPEFEPPGELPKSSAGGKPLRSAVYWPQAEDRSVDIRRVPAKDGLTSTQRISADSAREASLPSVDTLANELRSIGASRYRMVQSGKNYLFTCEFDTPASSGEPVVFRAESPQQAAAMQKVLLQAHQWNQTRR